MNAGQLRMIIALYAAAYMSCCAATEAYCSDLKTSTIAVQAPFEMPPISVPDFSACPEFAITDYGARAEDQQLTSQAITKAIDAAHAAGGGRVVIPTGEWPTAKIHLKSNVNLHLAEGAVLTFSENPDDYLPAVKSTWEGMECYNYSPLVYAYECQNVAITGNGTLHAKLDVWKKWYARPQPHMQAIAQLYHMAAKGVPVDQRQMAEGENHLRPQFIQFNRCENVLLEGISIKNSPFWVIHPFLSKNVVIRNVNVNARGHNNDGVDPEMSQNVLIEDCLFNQGDDAIAVKSGRNQDAWRLNTPAKNIVIRNCQIINGHQLLAIGSELSGGVENVLVENCEVDPSLTGVGHLLYIKTNLRRGGYAKNITMRNVTSGDLRYGVLGIETNVLYQWKNLVPTYEEKLTPIQDVFVENIQAGSVKYLSHIDGESALPVRNIVMAGVSVKEVRDEKFKNKNVEDFHHEAAELEISALPVSK